MRLKFVYDVSSSSLEPLESQINTGRAGAHYLRSDRVERSAGDGDSASRGEQREGQFQERGSRRRSRFRDTSMPVESAISRNGEGDCKTRVDKS